MTRRNMRDDDRRDDRRNWSYSGRDPDGARGGDAGRRGEVDEFGRPLRRDRPNTAKGGGRGGGDVEARGWKRARSRSRSRSPGPPAKRGRDDAEPLADPSARGGRGEGVRSAPKAPPPPPNEAPPPPPPDDAEAEMMALMGFGGFGSTAGKHVDDRRVNVGAARKRTTRKARQYMNRPGGFNRPLPEEKTGIKQNKI